MKFRQRSGRGLGGGPLGGGGGGGAAGGATGRAAHGEGVGGRPVPTDRGQERRSLTFPRLGHPMFQQKSGAGSNTKLVRKIVEMEKNQPGGDRLGHSD